AFVTDLEQTWLSKRSAAWLLFVTIVSLTLLVPLSKFAGRADGKPLPWSNWDRQWTAGPLYPAHLLATGENCNACHAVPFVRVRDQECTKCHDRTNDHIERSLAERANIEHVRCGACHQEHESPPHLVMSANSLCTDCHANPERFTAIATL